MTTSLDLIKEICEEQNIPFEEFPDNMIIRTKKNGFFFMCHSNLNSAASGKIADDKVATYSLLKHANIPAVTHILIRKEMPEDEILSRIESTNLPFIVKPCCGLKGKDVTLCDTKENATNTIHELSKKYDAICLSPFLNAPHEYRCFYLDEKVYFTFRKTRSKDSFLHNLSKGATPSLIDQQSKKCKELSQIAIAAAKAIGIRFAAVDILESETGELKVLEINQAFSISHITESFPETKKIFKELYTQAIKNM